MLRIKEKTKPANSVRKLRVARELTMAQLGELIGTDASTINKLEKGAMQLTGKWLSPMAKALGVTADELLASPDAPPPEVRLADIVPPRRDQMPNDLPVRGTAAGSHMRGAFHLETSVVDYVRRPPALMGAMNAYALYVEGNSMVPEHRPGDLRFVHPDRPPRIGDSVVIQIQTHATADPEAMIGHLVRRTENAVFIGKLNPEATVELKRETVKAIHKILSLNDLFGV